MFSGPSALRNPVSDKGFALWGELLQTAIQVGGAAYTSGQAKDIEEEKLAFQREQAASEAEIQKLELAIKQQQVNLLAQANEKPSMLDSVGTLTTPTNLALLAGAGVGIGLLVYFLTKK